MSPPLLLPLLVLIAGFYMAWNIGANDVANAMGTSVGSRALTLRRAVLLAALLEFAGAFFLGSSVSGTLQSGILNTHLFAATPLLFALGMLASLLATGLLLQLASFFGLPVSTTHAIVGSVIGFGWALQGAAAIQWPLVASIGLSWLLSPLLSGLVSYLLFRFIQQKIHFAPDPARASLTLSPLFSLLCLTTLSLSLTTSLLLSLAIGLFGALALRLLPSPALASATAPLSQPTESPFIPLQIASASLVAFAHGANDIANAIGPVAAALQALQSAPSLTPQKTPLWLLALGGAGIVLGLATWGWRVIETIGQKITELTPTKGFAAEFGAALTILLASHLGLPISTTHALIGSVLGVGLASNAQKINLATLRDIFLSWIVTLPLCALLTIVSFYALKSLFA